MLPVPRLLRGAPPTHPPRTTLRYQAPRQPTQSTRIHPPFPPLPPLPTPLQLVRCLLALLSSHTTASALSCSSPPQLVRDLLAKGKAHGFNVMRTWAHAVNPQYATQARGLAAKGRGAGGRGWAAGPGGRVLA